MSLWERHKAFNHPLTIRSFLYTTARNKSLNHLRGEKRLRKKQHKFAYLSEATETKNIQHILIEVEVYRELYAGIKTLPLQCQKIFMLLLSGKDYQEISKELNISLSTIYSQKARGLMLLRQRLPLESFYLLLGIIGTQTVYSN